MALFDHPSSDQGVFNFGIDETAKGYLLDTARWTKFLSVVGFVLLGILLLAGVFSTMIFSTFSSRYGGLPGYSGSMLTAVYVLMAVLYFFPTYFLFKFSTLIKPALLSADQDSFNSALSYLRNAFRFIGILMLVILGIYALIFIIAIIAMAFT